MLSIVSNEHWCHSLSCASPPCLSSPLGRGPIHETTEKYMTTQRCGDVLVWPQSLLWVVFLPSFQTSSASVRSISFLSFIDLVNMIKWSIFRWGNYPGLSSEPKEPQGSLSERDRRVKERRWRGYGSRDQSDVAVSQGRQVLGETGRAKELPPWKSAEVTLATPCAQKTPFRLLTARTVRELIWFIYH